MKKTVRVIISGKVQGVWYRASTKQMAEKIGITGWVRNTSEGNVEAMFEGEEDLVNEMIEWCNQGPPLARVDNLTIENIENKEKFDGFNIKY